MSRGLVFGVIVVVCTLVAAGYVALAVVRDESGPAGDPTARLTERTAPDAPATIVFQHVGRDAGYAKVAAADTGHPDDRQITPLTCERVHYAGGRGLCLKPQHGLLGAQFKAIVFGPDFRPLGEVTMNGIITRARVSPDGRHGAATGFVTGHSYAQEDQFSTQTKLIDMQKGKIIADLEDFEIIDDGKRIRPRDRNFWGVTFAGDGNRFYATLQTGGQRYLMEGDIGRRRLRTLHENVECPSLSPDETRIAYKKRIGGGSQWRLHVLDLRSGRETPLAEQQSVDDQAEWLDDGHVLYGLNGHVWSVPADGSGAPRKVLADALSPAVQR